MRRIRLAFLPDIHVPFQDDAALAEALDLFDWWQPEHIFILGDLLDCYSISRHRKGRQPGSTQEEIDLARALLSELRHRHPCAKIDLLEGNHERRLHDLIQDKAPGLESLRALSWPKLLGLKDLGIRWTQYQGVESILEPFGDGFKVEHGHIARNAYPAATPVGMLKLRDACGVTGHTHRMGWVCRQANKQTIWWAECGHIASLDVAAEYSKGPPNWQQGFAIGTLEPNGRVHLTLVPLDRDRKGKPRAVLPGWRM